MKNTDITSTMTIEKKSSTESDHHVNFVLFRNMQGETEKAHQ
jgi:hypothetical protein